MTTPQHFSNCVDQYDPNALPVGAAQEIVRQWAMPRGDAPVERVSLYEALDRVLANDVISPIDVPLHDNSAMDGYAFDGAALRGDVAYLTLSVAGRALAGRPFDGERLAGQCVRIMTGALIPPGCDTVVPQERVQREGARSRSPSPGSCPARTGASPARTSRKDKRRCERAVSCAPRTLGLLASLGIGRSVGAAACAGRVLFDRRRAALGRRAARSRQRLRQQPLHLVCDAAPDERGTGPTWGSCSDDRASLDAALRQATREADVVISSGGRIGGRRGLHARG